ncbi:unnamed protein product [Acanthoscelides obtectus]|uniref:Arf-GAP domain-containing protein n=1 Tax=Acanthoscelides obtectus TaxID=200917 RepID=A0A9P0NUZ9_ACAOB|nr:unnamed protein product [Acanthoscelides obtectus]CAK1624967.1 Stromal membrane-associated protein 2 [Acanthoscelides obtectus]
MSVLYGLQQILYMKTSILGPRWASWNIGVFLCIRCAGIHRNLGVHISKVKSVNLDSWTPEQVVSLQQMGNSRARAVYEANLPDNFRRPQNDSSLESFIRAKYEHKKYIAREWVPPQLPKVDWEKEIEEEMEKQRRKKKTVVSTSPAVTEKKVLEGASVEVPQLPKPTNPSPKSGRTNKLERERNKEKKDSDLLGIQNGEDNFSNFVSAQPKADEKESNTDVQKEEENFFNQVLPTEKEKAKLDKDSILALYANTPATYNKFSQIPGQPMVVQNAFSGFPQQPPGSVYSVVAQNGLTGAAGLQMPHMGPQINPVITNIHPVAPSGLNMTQIQGLSNMTQSGLTVTQTGHIPPAMQSAVPPGGQAMHLGHSGLNQQQWANKGNFGPFAVGQQAGFQQFGGVHGQQFTSVGYNSAQLPQVPPTAFQQQTYQQPTAVFNNSSATVVPNAMYATPNTLQQQFSNLNLNTSNSWQ